MSLQNETQAMRRGLKRAGLAAAAIAVLILAAGSYIRLVEASSLKSWTRDEEIPTVALIRPAGSGMSQALTLPGSLQAYYDASLYSRVPGYVKSWSKDIGAHVKRGDLLAVIDTPELDQQIAQARADLGAARAAARLSGTTAQRWNDLLPLDAVSRQDAEEKQEDFAAKSGKVGAAQAELDRFLAMKAFARITAPFDGVVTRRNADIGALVGTSSSGEPLFAVADIHALRVYVNVPQSYSAQITPGMQASLVVPEYPGRSFPARLVSTSGAIASGSSTLLVEFEAANPGNQLKPGDFAQVSMGLPAQGGMLRLPASALLFRSEGLRVATLGRDGRVKLKPVTIATDLGTEVVIGTGLAPQDRVVDNPPDSLTDGDKVRVGHAP